MAAFGFGLIRGFGFAALLEELGMAKQSLVLAFLVRRSRGYSGQRLWCGSTCMALLAKVWMGELNLDRRWRPSKPIKLAIVLVAALSILAWRSRQQERAVKT